MTVPRNVERVKEAPSKVLNDTSGTGLAFRIVAPAGIVVLAITASVKNVNSLSRHIIPTGALDSRNMEKLKLSLVKNGSALHNLYLMV